MASIESTVTFKLQIRMARMINLP